MTETPTHFGAYRPLRLIATGGMAEVWLARETGGLGTGRLVVLKRILPHETRNKALVSSFIDEARLSIRLNHPNIVKVLFVGEDPEPFLVLELIDGINLEQILDRLAEQTRYLSVPTAVYVIAEICRALQYAHGLTDEHGQSLQVTHRDVSPPNILLDRHGMVKLADFGIAKARGRITKTRLGLLKGKSPYLSPEQAGGKTIDARSDLFSLGTVFWECLTGRRLFDSGDDLQNLRLVQTKKIPPPSHVRTAVDAELDPIVLRLLARDPRERYADAGEVLFDLEQTRAHREAQRSDIARLVEEIEPEPLAAQPIPTAELAPTETATVPRRRLWRRSWRLAALLALLCLAALPPAWRVLRQHPAPSLPQPPAVNLENATLIVQPATRGAIMYWDGRFLGAAPMAGRETPDGKRHRLTLLAAGYAPYRKRFSFSKPRVFGAETALSRLSGTMLPTPDETGIRRLAGRELEAGDSLRLPAGLYLAQDDRGASRLVAVPAGPAPAHQEKK